MVEVRIKIKIITGGKPPEKMSPGAVGYDVFARLEKPLVLDPGARALVPAGFEIEIPEGFEAQIRPRSGLAIGYGLVLLNSPGTIDPDYRGEVKVILANLGQKDIIISNGDRIAQMVISPVALPQIEITENLSESKRGKNGFGSTGV